MTKSKKKISKAGRKTGPDGPLLPPLQLRLPPALKENLEREMKRRAIEEKNPRWSLPDEIRLQLSRQIETPDYEDGMSAPSRVLGAMAANLADKVSDVTERPWSVDNFSRTVLEHAFRVLLTVRFKGEPYPEAVPAAALDWASAMSMPTPDPASPTYATDFAAAIGRDLALFLHHQLSHERVQSGAGPYDPHLYRAKQLLGKIERGDK